MKTDLFTSIIIFVAGTAVAFVATNMMVPPVEDFEFKTITIEDDASLVAPNNEIFNYRAINPTVEVYVGEGCELYDEDGACVDNGILGTEENEENAEIEEGSDFGNPDFDFPDNNNQNSGEYNNGFTD